MDKVPYLVYLERFGTDYFFLKFHPGKHNSNPNKYKLRTNNKTLPIRILSTCLTIAVQQMKKHPNMSFGIYGQWDQKDVIQQVKSSQRFHLWLQIAINKINPDSYKLVQDPNYNFFMLIPAHKYSGTYIKEIENYFSKRFKSKLNELPVPTITDYQSYKFR